MNRRSDNTFRGARTLQFDRTIRDAVGQRDRIDLYKFTASGSSSFSMLLSGLRGNANVRLLSDRSRTIATSNQRGNRPERITNNLEAGIYYLEVRYVDRRGATPYRLSADLTTIVEPPPPPPPPPGDGNNSIATAFDIGVLSTTYVKQDVVGIDDPVDFYKFTLNDITNLELRVEHLLGGGRYELIRDDNNNGLVDTSEIYRFGFSGLPPTDIPPGTYFLRASTSNSASRYRLSFVPTLYRLTFIPTLFGGNVSPDPGRTLATAFDLGVYSGTRVIKEYVGLFDTKDLYRFTLNDLSNLQISVTSPTSPAEISLIRDDNNNGLIDSGETYYSTRSFGSNLNVALPSGNYFIDVGASFGNNSSLRYEMTLVGTPYGGNELPDPGNTLSDARDLGVLSGTSSLKEYVGRLDQTDVYRFTLNNEANLQARITSSSVQNINMNVFRDANNNGLFDNNENIYFGIDQLAGNLQAGAYFLWLEGRFGGFSTNYQLDLIVP